MVFESQSLAAQGCRLDWVRERPELMVGEHAPDSSLEAVGKYGNCSNRDLLPGTMIKNLARKLLLSSRALRLAARFRSKRAAILMYHSVMDDPRQVADSLGGIVHSTEVFQGQMELLARQFRPVDLDRLASFVKGEQDLPEHAVAITFDDGYRDNYELAMPILNRFGIPAAFYVTVDSIERRKLPWPSRLRFSFRTTSEKEFRDESGHRWSLGSPEQRERAYLGVCDQVCKLAGAALENRVAQMEQALEAQLSSDSGRLMMTWEQVKQLAQHGHIVGSHTMTHPNLAFLALEQMRSELRESKQRMEAHVNAPVQHFSYPCPALFPNWTEQTVEESRRVGYQTAVTTSTGLTRPNDNPLGLKRVRPTKTVEGLEWTLESAFAGRAL
jgi:peptidoglycan/xylan/chitin deacetylase (PgdA/CDA1 family)